jgi:hypothetical protein
MQPARPQHREVKAVQQHKRAIDLPKPPTAMPKAFPEERHLTKSLTCRGLQRGKLHMHCFSSHTVGSKNMKQTILGPAVVSSYGRRSSGGTTTGGNSNRNTMIQVSEA